MDPEVEMNTDDVAGVGSGVGLESVGSQRTYRPERREGFL